MRNADDLGGCFWRQGASSLRLERWRKDGSVLNERLLLFQRGLAIEERDPVSGNCLFALRWCRGRSRS